MTTATRVAPALSATALLGAAHAELLGLRGGDDQTLWAVGDRALELCAELAGKRVVDGREVRVTKTMIRAAIADTVGLQPSAVRGRERVSAYWQGADRDAPGLEVFTYGYYREVMRSPHPMVELDWCLDEMPKWGGNCPPLRVLRKRIDAAKGKAALTFEQQLAATRRSAAKLHTAADTDARRLDAALVVERLEAMQ